MNLVPLKICTRLLSLITLKSEAPNQECTNKQAKIESGQREEEAAVVSENSEDVKDSVGEAQDKMKDKEKQNDQSTQADNADIPIYSWDMVLNPEEDLRKTEALNRIRLGVLRWCNRRLCREFVQWYFGKHTTLRILWEEMKLSPLEKITECVQTLQGSVKRSVEARRDWEAGRECTAQYSNSSWWEWTEGSRPNFWRWPLEYQRPIRDGAPPWFRTKVPNWKVRERVERDPVVWRAMRDKLEKVKTLGNVQPGTVSSLTSYFSVPKGDSDIRMVYDGTKSGLNDSMWAPWFALPTIENHLRFVGVETYLGDTDIGDMFHNFVLHERVQKSAGIDVTPFFPEELTRKRELKAIWLRWVRSAMGLKSSPYNSIQGILVAEEVIKGDPLDEQSIFRWDYIELNLLGDPTYQPGLPWICKRRKSDGCPVIL